MKVHTGAWIAALSLAAAGCSPGAAPNNGDDDDDDSTGVDAAPNAADSAPQPDSIPGIGNDVEPALWSGGGVGSGAIDGELNVYVIDSDEQPVAGATVFVGDAVKQGTTDGSGLVTFQDTAMTGAQTVTAVATGYAAGTYLGANGANVTIALSDNPRDIPVATASGTIAGWDSLSPDGLGNYIIAVVLYSFSDDVGGPENTLRQPGPADSPKNICIKLDNEACNWEMNVRTGRQVHYAVIARGDSKLSNDPSDDTYELIGYAALGAVDVTAGANLTGETLTMLDGGALVDVSVTIPAGPAGLGDTTALPFLDLGADGQMVFPFPPLKPGATASRIPAATGAYAGGSYTMMGIAVPNQETSHPFSTTFARAVSPGAVTLAAWQIPPSGLTGAAGSFSFTPGSGAALHTATFLNSGGSPVWNVTLVDGSTSFAVPAVTPSPLPSGSYEMRVSGLSVPTFSPADFALGDFLLEATAGTEASASVTN